MLIILPAAVTKVSPKHGYSACISSSGWDECGEHSCLWGEDEVNLSELLQLHQGLWMWDSRGWCCSAQKWHIHILSLLFWFHEILTLWKLLWMQRGIKGAYNVVSNFCEEICIDHPTPVHGEPSTDTPSDLWMNLLNSTDSWAASEDHQPSLSLLAAVNNPQKTTPTSQEPPHILTLRKQAQETRREVEFRTFSCSFSHMRIPEPMSGRSFKGKLRPSAVSFLFLAF